MLWHVWTNQNNADTLIYTPIYNLLQIVWCGIVQFELFSGMILELRIPTTNPWKNEKKRRTLFLVILVGGGQQITEKHI